jgi:NitT/TauT family transport system ATP-binding protein
MNDQPLQETIELPLDPASPPQAQPPDKIVIRAVAKTFRSQDMVVTALDGFDLRIREGEFICVVGPSGCGKTTLLRILAGLEMPTSGEITIARRDKTQPLTSMIFQESSIFPWMRVRDNVAYGLDIRHVAADVRKRVVDHFLELTGLMPLPTPFRINYRAA